MLKPQRYDRLSVSAAPHERLSDHQRTRPLLVCLDRVLQIAKDTPPVDNKLSRFGNPAFRTFYDRVTEASTSLHEDLIPQSDIPEVQVYFNEAWGNRQRVDYGSGMELNFLCWLYVCVDSIPFIAQLTFRQILFGQARCRRPRRLLLPGLGRVLEIYPGHAVSAVDVLVGARWIAWRVGSGRLPVLAFPVGCWTAER